MAMNLTLQDDCLLAFKLGPKIISHMTLRPTLLYLSLLFFNFYITKLDVINTETK